MLTLAVGVGKDFIDFGCPELEEHAATGGSYHRCEFAGLWRMAQATECIAAFNDEYPFWLQRIGTTLDTCYPGIHKLMQLML